MVTHTACEINYGLSYESHVCTVLPETVKPHLYCSMSFTKWHFVMRHILKVCKDELIQCGCFEIRNGSPFSPLNRLLQYVCCGWRSTDRHRTYAYGLAWRKHIWLSGFKYVVIYIFFCDVKHILISKIILSAAYYYYYWVAQWYRYKCYHLAAPGSLVWSWTQLSCLCRISCIVSLCSCEFRLESSVSSHLQKNMPVGGLAILNCA